MRNLSVVDIKKTDLDDTFLKKYIYHFLTTYLTYFLARTALIPKQISILSLLTKHVA